MEATGDATTDVGIGCSKSADVVRGVGPGGGAWIWRGNNQTPSRQAAASGQGPSDRFRAAVGPSVTVQAFECVQVPVTYSQTFYRSECRTENVPVTAHGPRNASTKPETSAATCRSSGWSTSRSFATSASRQPSCRSAIDRSPSPRTSSARCYQTTARPRWQQGHHPHDPECVTETVPVTRMHRVVEPQTCYVTQRMSVTSYVPVVTCAHTVRAPLRRRKRGLRRCDHLRSVRPGHDLHRTAGPGHKAHREIHTRRRRTCSAPHEIQPRAGNDHMPPGLGESDPLHGQSVHQHVRDAALRGDRCRMVPRPITETVTVCETTMIPHTSQVVVPTVKFRPVTETVTRQTRCAFPTRCPSLS